MVFNHKSLSHELLFQKENAIKKRQLAINNANSYYVQEIENLKA